MRTMLEVAHSALLMPHEEDMAGGEEAGNAPRVALTGVHVTQMAGLRDNGAM